MVKYFFKGALTGAGDASEPADTLLNLGGTLYGASIQGGGGCDDCVGRGAIYSFAPATGTEAVPAIFEGGPGAPDGGGVGGASGVSGLVNVGGVLYGTTGGGGTDFSGAIYSFNPATKAAIVVYSFTGGADGAEPDSLIYHGGYLYGVARQGGAHGDGTVFRFELSTGVQQVLHAFGATTADWIGPIGNLALIGGKLYGTTVIGGTPDSGGKGTIYAVKDVPSTAAGAFTVIHSFTGGADGTAPPAGLLNVGGVLYGTTNGNCVGAEPGPTCGTIFQVTP